MVKLVAVCRDDEDYPYESRQLPVDVDKNLKLVLQLDDPLQSGYRNSNAKSDLRTFIKNYNILNVEEVKQACMMNGKDLSTFLSHMVPCVGCRRSVEQMFHQLADQGHPALDPLLVTAHKTMFIKRNVSSNPTALYKLFYHDVYHMYGLIENILKNKKNKRCFIHSLEMQKPRLGRSLALSPNAGQACTNVSSLPPSQPTNIPYYGNGSWMDIWNDLSNDCKEEVVILDCEGILDLMEEYLKRHRFCKDCKSKVARAFGILVDEIDPKKESGYCSALYVGLRFCGPKSRVDFEKIADAEDRDRDSCDDDEEHDDDDEDCCHDHDHGDLAEICARNDDDPPPCEDKSHTRKLTLEKDDGTFEIRVTSNQSRHIHVCCETNYIAHLMTRAEAEISGGSLSNSSRRERHAKTIDVAQEEVLTCISLYLYERLHKLWRKVKAESQTWRVLFYVSVETMRRVFEIVVEEKVGMGKLEALCEELEQEERKLEEKQEKKRQKKKRQKKRKEEAKKQEVICNGTTVKPDSPVEDSPSVVTVESESKPVQCTKNDKTSAVVKNTCSRQTCRKEEANGHTGYHTYDLGYSSGCCESSVSSREGSDVTCSDGFCNHDENDCSEKENKAAFQLKCSKKPVDSCGSKGRRSCDVASAPPPASLPPPSPQAEGLCDDCMSSQDVKSNKKGKKKNHCVVGGGRGGLKPDRGNFQLRLLEMLGEEPEIFSNSRGQKEKSGELNGEMTGSASLNPDEDLGAGDEGLTAEEIAEFEQNRNQIREERIVLREKIRKNFEQLCGKQEKLLPATGGSQVQNQSSEKRGKTTSRK